MAELSRLIRFALLVLLALAQACDRGEPEAAPPGPSPHTKPVEFLVFESTLHVADSAVNAFVEHAMKTATSGDYAQFRLLWATREEPMPKAQFEEGWQAVQQVRILALEPAIVEMPARPDSGGAAAAASSTPETIQEDVYLVLADVRFDPAHPAGKKQPTREAVLMLVREQDQWRLAHAPKLMRDWIREKAGAQRGEKDAAPAGDREQD